MMTLYFALLAVQILLSTGGKTAISLYRLVSIATIVSAFGILLVSEYSLIASVLLLYTSILFAVIINYSYHYFESEENYNAIFVGAALLQLFSSLAIVSSTLLTLLLGFIGLSASLIYLISHYVSKSELTSIKRYFLTSDIFLALFIAALYINNQTVDLYAITDGGGYLLLLLVLSIAIKSAIFPCNKWLEKTVAVPAPVSAIMHAGVINLGLVLVYAFYPLIVANSVILTLLISLVLLGSLFGKSMLLTQVDEKRKLIFSTSGQLSYMYLQAGLGFFAGAFYHLMLHGLLKSNLFLSQASQYNAQNTIEKPNRYSDLLLVTISLMTAAIVFTNHDVNMLIIYFITFSTLTFIYDCYRSSGFKHALCAALFFSVCVGFYIYLFGMMSIYLTTMQPALSLPVSFGLLIVYSVAYIFRQSISEWLLVNYPYYQLKLHANKMKLSGLFTTKSSERSVQLRGY